jgi:hypothetical protein
LYFPRIATSCAPITITFDGFKALLRNGLSTSEHTGRYRVAVSSETIRSKKAHDVAAFPLSVEQPVTIGLSIVSFILSIKSNTMDENQLDNNEVVHWVQLCLKAEWNMKTSSLTLLSAGMYTVNTTGTMDSKKYIVYGCGMQYIS